METWRPKLLASIRAENEWVLQQKKDLQKNVRDLAHKKECCNCRLLCYSSDMIMLLCQHAHCFDCVSDRLERLTGYLEKKNISPLPILKNLMVCSRCHKPTAVKYDTVDNKRIAQQDRGGRARYVISPNATELKSTVRSYYQNQRRSILGKFKFKALWPFERPRFTSCEEGMETKEVDLRALERLNVRGGIQGSSNKDTASSVKSGISVPIGGSLADALAAKSYSSPNLTSSSRMHDSQQRAVGGSQQQQQQEEEEQAMDVELYLEDWSYDTVDGDPLGWHYAFNWPKHASEWTFVPSSTTFVRRRRMYRASITLSKIKPSEIFGGANGGVTLSSGAFSVIANNSHNHSASNNNVISNASYSVR